MNNKKLVLNLSGLVLLMLNIGTACAETAGNVQFVNGEVTLTTANGVPRTLQKGDSISEGDSVGTAQNAAAQIRMQDGGLIALRADSQLKFDSVRFSGKAGHPEKSYFSLSKGGVRVITGVIAHVNKQEYEISTPAATIDMRGADQETLYVPADVPGADAGTYSKVNVGEATLKTNSGTVSVLSNQMGFAGGQNQSPRIRPLNAGIFTVAIAQREAEVGKENGGVQNPQDVTGNKQEIAVTKQEQRPAAQAHSENFPTSFAPVRNTSVVDYKRLASTINTTSITTLDIPENTINTTVVTPPTPPTVFPIMASYTMVAGIQPVDSAGINGTLNGSTLNLDLTNQLVSAALNLTMPSGLMAGTYAVAANNLPINIVASGNGSGIFGGNVNCTGACAAGASGYSSLLLSTAAGLSYNIGPTTATTGLLQGSVAYFTTTITPPAVVPSAAYNPNHVAVESAGNFGTGSGGMASSLSYTKVGAGNLATSGAPSSMTLSNFASGSGSTSTSTMAGGAASSANAPAFATTGIQYGAWTVTLANPGGSSTSVTTQLGAQNGNTPSSWMYGPQGYVDAAYLSVVLGGSLSGAMAGTFTYQMDGATVPHSINSGLNGTLNNASITVNFANNSLNANLALTMPGNENWGAVMTNQPFTGSVFNSTVGTMAVTRSVGATAPLATCATCGGNLGGAFTGQNYAGAILSYNLFNNAQSVNDVTGNIALTRVSVAGNPVLAQPATPTPTVSTVLTLGGGIVLPAVTTTATTTPLTTYTWLTSNGATNTATVNNCNTCTATASGQVATSGIYYGNWTAGSLTQTSSLIFTTATPPSYWITGPEAGPVYLPQALTGTATYVFNSGQASNAGGWTGTFQNTTALMLDFNKQTVGINLDVSVPDPVTLTVTHAWNAKTLPGNEALLGRSQVLCGASFQVSTTNIGGAGLLTVSADGGLTAVANPSATINGQLTGIGLTGAIISFNLGGTLNAATTPIVESINGVAAFSGTAANIATPYRYVSMAFYDPFAALPQPAVGLYANSATRVTQNLAGNLIQFDTQIINNIGGGSKAYANSTGTLADHGFDPVSGISWGRWSGGTINVTDRTTGVVTAVTQAGSLHWITEPVATSATTLPTAGTYTYVRAGGTSPTDNLGNVGTLNAATLAANFTAGTVNLGVNTTVAGATLNATGTNVPIIQQTAFYASSKEPAASTSYLTVACTGTCGGNPGGTVVGKFTGAGAVGAIMSYGLQNGSSVVSGVAAFHR